MKKSSGCKGSAVKGGCCKSGKGSKCGKSNKVSVDKFDAVEESFASALENAKSYDFVQGSLLEDSDFEFDGEESFVNTFPDFEGSDFVPGVPDYAEMGDDELKLHLDAILKVVDIDFSVKVTDVEIVRR